MILPPGFDLTPLSGCIWEHVGEEIPPDNRSYGAVIHEAKPSRPLILGVRVHCTAGSCKVLTAEAAMPEDLAKPPPITDGEIQETDEKMSSSYGGSYIASASPDSQPQNVSRNVFFSSAT